MTALQRYSRQSRQLDAGIFQAEISSFRLYLTAGGSQPGRSGAYTEAVQWFATVHLPRQISRDGWEQVDGQDIQQWVAWLLANYSDAYASNQYRALQQFFRWLAAEDEIPDPMAGLQAPKVTAKLVPVFTGGELARIGQACTRRSFAQRRDAAVIAVFLATGIRMSELAGIMSDAHDPGRSDIDLWQREITIRGKAASHPSSRSPTTLPAPWTATCGSAASTPRRAGRSCGWAPATGGR